MFVDFHLTEKAKQKIVVETASKSGLSSAVKKIFLSRYFLAISGQKSKNVYKEMNLPSFRADEVSDPTWGRVRVQLEGAGLG